MEANLTLLVPLSPAYGGLTLLTILSQSKDGIFNMKWRGGNRERGKGRLEKKEFLP
jgi:hypothetical protein